MGGRLVQAGDTKLFVLERGDGPLPLFVLHGGPGMDHTMFGSHLDGLSDSCRLLFVDQRSQGRSDPAPPDTWTLEEMAADVDRLAHTLELERYAVLGHSFGAFVALQHAVDFPGRPAATIVSSGVPSSAYLEAVQRNLEAFEPVELREQVTRSWAREAEAQTQEDCQALLWDQLPFHFRDPHDPRIDVMRAGLGEAVYAPDVLRAAATTDYGAIEVEERLASVSHPVLVLAGRHDRTCSVDGAQAIADGIPDAELMVFENSGHMTFIEEQDRYVAAVRDFLVRRT
ncbi:MAG TPA: alpha/beta fold hydrolase [Solirubrobacteraceae bacterium]|nr:alpha/beta fold hydrolase [Solirubrobacteraceae bacterium]